MHFPTERSIQHGNAPTIYPSEQRFFATTCVVAAESDLLDRDRITAEADAFLRGVVCVKRTKTVNLIVVG